MLEVYRQLPFDFAVQYRMVLAQIADGGLPLVFCCAAGKDRTGVAAALILALLGVPFRTILRDYTMTGPIIAADRALASSARHRRFYDFPESAAESAIEALLGADPDYLRAAFGSIRERSGGIDRYWTAIGVTAHEIAEVRARLVGNTHPTP